MGFDLAALAGCTVAVLTAFGLGMRRLDRRFEAIDRRIDELRSDMLERFAAVDRRFEAVDKRFDAVDKRFEAVDRRFEAMDERIDGLERRFDGRFADLAAAITAQTLQIGNLRQDVGRLEGVVERNYEPHRFPGAAAAVKEQGKPYDDPAKKPDR